MLESELQEPPYVKLKKSGLGPGPEPLPTQTWVAVPLEIAEPMLSL